MHESWDAEAEATTRADGWGIVRYSPHIDEAHFDGWYAMREAAEEVFKDWSEHYPGFIVAIVKQDETRWLAERPCPKPHLLDLRGLFKGLERPDGW